MSWRGVVLKGIQEGVPEHYLARFFNVHLEEVEGWPQKSADNPVDVLTQNSKSIKPIVSENIEALTTGIHSRGRLLDIDIVEKVKREQTEELQQIVAANENTISDLIKGPFSKEPILDLSEPSFDVPLWVVLERAVKNDTAAEDSEGDNDLMLPPVDLNEHFYGCSNPPSYGAEPIVLKSTLRRYLQSFLQKNADVARSVDAEYIKDLAELRPPKRIHYKVQRRTVGIVDVIIDRRSDLMAFWKEQNQICSLIRDYLPTTASINIVACDDIVEKDFTSCTKMERWKPNKYSADVVIVISDFGAMPNSPLIRTEWMKFGKEISGRATVVFLSIAPSDRGVGVCKVNNVLFCNPTRMGSHKEDVSGRLAVLLLPCATYLDYNYVRRVRKEFFPWSDIRVEYDFWNRREIVPFPDSRGGRIGQGLISALEKRYQDLEAPERRRNYQLLMKRNATVPNHIAMVERVVTASLYGEEVPQEVNQWFEVAIKVTRQTSVMKENFAGWITRVFHSIPEGSRTSKFFGQYMSRMSKIAEKITDSTRASLKCIRAIQLGDCLEIDVLNNVDKDFRVTERGPVVASICCTTGFLKEDKGIGHLLGSDASSFTYLPHCNNITIYANSETCLIGVVLQPRWAKSYGMDHYGLFADISILNMAQPFTHRLRWIPKGSLEVANSEVEIQKGGGDINRRVFGGGFWISELPVSVQFCQSVDGSDNSCADCYGIAVSMTFEQCERWVARISSILPKGFVGRLPTPDEWNYVYLQKIEDPLYSPSSHQRVRSPCYPYLDLEQLHFTRNYYGIMGMNELVAEWCGGFPREIKTGDDNMRVENATCGFSIADINFNDLHYTYVRKTNKDIVLLPWRNQESLKPKIARYIEPCFHDERVESDYIGFRLVLQAVEEESCE